jgi:hypothetical protein
LVLRQPDKQAVVRKLVVTILQSMERFTDILITPSLVLVVVLALRQYSVKTDTVLVVLVVLVVVALLAVVELVVLHFNQLKLWFLLAYSLAATTVTLVSRAEEEVVALVQLLLAPLVAQEYKLT